jgi:hypothetical protein
MHGMDNIKLANHGSIPSRDKRFFSSPKCPDQPPTEWIREAFCLGVK